MNHGVMEYARTQLTSTDATAVARIGRQLGHPLRVELLAYVGSYGPCPFSELAALVSASQAQVSNHLAGLRRAGLVATERQGRQSLYRVPNSHIAEVLANLMAAAGVEARSSLPLRTASGDARRCYDHIGGTLGVCVLDAIVKRGGLTPETSGDGLVPGPHAEKVLRNFGVRDWNAMSGGRRRTAYGCPDWTEKRPHLGGAVGAAVSEFMTGQGWVEEIRGSRALELTGAGRRALADRGVQI